MARRGEKTSEETKQKQRESNLGKKRSEETKRRISFSHLGISNKKKGSTNITKNCLNCGNPFTRTKSEMKNQGGCCKVQCGLDYYFRSHKRENHPNWKGNRVPNRSIRTRFWREIRNEVLKRDNYTCQLCGATENLHVDHIQRWEDYVDLRFVVDNCRTVCMACHYQITFGKPMPESVKKWGWLSKTKK